MKEPVQSGKNLPQSLTKMSCEDPCRRSVVRILPESCTLMPRLLSLVIDTGVSNRETKRKSVYAPPPSVDKVHAPPRLQAQAHQSVLSLVVQPPLSLALSSLSVGSLQRQLFLFVPHTSCRQPGSCFLVGMGRCRLLLGHCSLGPKLENACAHPRCAQGVDLLSLILNSLSCDEVYLIGGLNGMFSPASAPSSVDRL